MRAAVFLDSLPIPLYGNGIKLFLIAWYWWLQSVVIEDYFCRRGDCLGGRSSSDLCWKYINTQSCGEKMSGHAKRTRRPKLLIEWPTNDNQFDDVFRRKFCDLWIISASLLPCDIKLNIFGHLRTSSWALTISSHQTTDQLIKTTLTDRFINNEDGL